MTITFDIPADKAKELQEAASEVHPHLKSGVVFLNWLTDYAKNSIDELNEEYGVECE